MSGLSKFVGQYGGWVALAAAAALTSKGEYDLAVMVHYPWFLAWLFPVACDVYLATAATRKAGGDVAISLVLMIGAQVAVHLTDHFITEGEQVPWGLVIPVSCIPPIVAWRAKALAGGHKAEADAAAAALRQVEQRAQAAVAESDRRRQQAEAQLRDEQQRREADRQAAEAQIRDAQESRDEAQRQAETAQRKADRAAFRATQARTQRDGDAVTQRPAADRTERLVTHDQTPQDPSVTRGVTHDVTHGGDASGPAGDAPASDDAPVGDVSLTREERLKLAVMEALNDESASARGAAMKHGLTTDADVQAVQRRVRAARRTEQGSPLARAGVNSTEPNLNTNP